jgi:hypothetical protein
MGTGWLILAVHGKEGNVYGGITPKESSRDDPK